MGSKTLGAAIAGFAAIALTLALPSAALAAPPVATAAQVGAAPAAQPLTLVFPLRADLAGLRQHALAVSTPGTAEYGAYEPVAALARRYGASAATRLGVRGYLRRAGGRRIRIDATGLFAEATFATGRAESLFSIPLARFRTAHGARFIAPAHAAAQPRLPVGLSRFATGVVGLDTRSLSPAPAASPSRRALAHTAAQASSARPLSGTPAGCSGGQGSGGFTPNQYLTAYGYDPLHAAGLHGQGERVALIEIDGFRYGDIRTFAACFGLDIPAVNGFGVGVSRPLAPGGEATLDLEVLLAAAPDLKSIDVYESHATAADTLRALTAPLSNRQTPQVISASLGLCEPALVSSVGGPGIDTAEAALQMASAAGVTFLASSGDQGSADCTLPDGTTAARLAVNYPASSWWVTGVGGTNLELTPGNAISSEVVWDDSSLQPGAAGGGGVSAVFGRPNYQNGATGARGRAVPDVSMLADIAPGYAIYCSASDCTGPPWQTVGGTSAATPLLAGGLALIDQALHRAHRQDLGLVNPLLYRSRLASPSIFYDVTAIGNDVGPQITSDGHLLGCCTAHVGFDTASGLGSVDVSRLGAYSLRALPPVVNVALSLPRGQAPVRSHQIRATVSCTAACVMGAYAEVTIGHKRPFEVDSSLFRLSRSGRKTIALHFGSGQLRSLRAGLRSHTRVSATLHAVVIDQTVYGVLANAGNAIQKRSAARTLAIHG